MMSVKRQEGVPLTRFQAFRLWWHHLICAVCKTWEDQSASIDVMLSRFWKENEANIAIEETEKMSEPKKEAIQHKLEEAMKG